MKPPEIILHITELLRAADIDPSEVKLTIEFLNPIAERKAEYALTIAVHQDRTLPVSVIETCREGKPWTMFALNLQVKPYEQPAKMGCQCEDCQRRRRIARG